MSGVVIVGAGQAGLQVAASLRELAYKGPIDLIGDEPELPYQRPPLSKAFLKGKASEDLLRLKPAQFFDKQQIGLRTGVRVARIDTAVSRVELAGGGTIGYAHLVLATGARNRKLSIEGADLAGIHYLRDYAEARALERALASVRTVVVIGAGFIGLEFAAVACELGKTVTVLDVAERVMARAVSPAISTHFEALHRAAGINLLLGATVRRLLGKGRRVTSVETSTGESLSADLVVIGIGVEPNVELAAEAGLAIASGIVVDRTLSTSNPAISAIGDCAAFPDVVDGAQVRLESVQNAIDQGKCVAARIAQSPRPYTASPWFWTDQGTARLQIAGCAPATATDVVRGDASAPAFSVFRFVGGRLRAVESVNAPQDHMAARRLITMPASLTPAEAADPSVDLKARAMGRSAARA
jgi:3-phenylpropionate/trans-cinnamate dioxygenase ferredoxin reductase component